MSLPFAPSSRLPLRAISNRWARAARILLPLLAAAVAPAWAQWVPNETRVSANRGLIDYEFSQSRGLLSHTDPNGALWIAEVDRTTGAFKPWHGRGQQLATNTVAGWNMFMWNGPEWLAGTNGDQIFFSYYLADKPRTANNTRMAVATESAGTWSVQPLDSAGQPRMSHIASRNPGDPNPTIKYLDPDQNHWWRNVLGGAATEERLDFLQPSTKSWRFASGMRALLYTAEVDGVPQVFRYRLDSKQRQQMTSDAGAKDVNRTVPWQFRAPEFNDDFVLLTFADGNQMRVYRQFAGAGPFQLVYAATLPAGKIAGSPEWFTYNGKSYVFFAVYNLPAEYPSEIWISSIDPGNPLFRRITDESALRARNDPEVFITSQFGPLIYYNRYDPSIDPDNPLCSACSEGVFRADPGLLGR